MSLFNGKATHIAVAQMNVHQDEITHNLAVAGEMIEAAASRGANLICLPATFATGLNFPSLNRMAQSTEDEIVSFLKEKADTCGVYLCAGLLEKQGNEVFDSAVLINDKGELLGSYQRTCLWEGERDFISNGKPQHVINTPLGKIGLLVSYDLRFPEACRNYFSENVDIIICVASLFAKFSHPVASICRARAADNGCCLVFASSIGNSRLAMMDYMGRSMIVNGLEEAISASPDTDILARAGSKEQLIDARVFARKINKVRSRQPYLVDYNRMLVAGEMA